METGKLNQSLVKMDSFPINKWAQKVKPILYETKNEKLEGLYLLLT